ANDTITGSAVANTLQGNDGNDTFFSSNGSDSIYGGRFDGTTHTDSATTSKDTVDYSNSLNNKINVDLSNTTTDSSGTYAQVVVDENNQDFSSPVYTDKVYGIENITGTTSNDTIYGNNLSNTLIGNAGSDTLKGAGGADKLDGGAGDDVFIIDNKADATGDEIIGGDNYDTVNYQGVDEGITVNLDGVTTATVTIAGNNHTLTGVEYVIGTEYNDNITGDLNLNKIQGMGGDDVISGQDGSDKIYGGADIADSTSSGNDTLDGKAGDDLIYGGDGDDSIYGGDGKDTLYGEAGNDVINGENDNDTIYAGAGNDQINGGLGADVIYAGSGNDVITFVQADNSSDIVYGGDENADSGIDTVDYSQAITGMTVTLANGNAQGTASSADQGVDSLYGIENIIGSNLAKDIITGNNVANTLSGLVGDDTIYGQDGNDTIFGGADNDELHGGNDIDSIDGGTGNDVIYGDAGDDILRGNEGDDKFVFTYSTDTFDGNDNIDGGANSDTVDYSAIIDSQYFADIDLTSQTSQIKDSSNSNAVVKSDTIVSIENAIGTSGNDTLRGNASVNSLNGGAGNDTVLYTFAALTAGVVANLNAGTVEKTVGTGTVIDTITSIENIVGSDYDDTFITKLTQTNIIDAGETDSIGAGALNGAEINGDTVDYSSNGASKIEVDLSAVDGSNYSTVIVSGAGAVNDILRNVENITGTSGNDTITGDDTVNTLLGMAGNDIIDGKGGADYIDGGAGNDTITGGTGADRLFGGIGNDLFIDSNFTGDVIDGGTETDTSRGSDTVDYSQVGTYGVNITLNDAQVTTVTINSETHTIVNIENITGTHQDDVITGDVGNNILKGNDGLDIIDGAAGDDTIDGGANATGIEILTGGAGLDTIYGGDGVDSIVGGADNDRLYGDDSLNSASMVNNDILDGGAGEDILYGGYGDDTLIGGADNDQLIGGEGSDTADYSNESASVNANISAGNAQGTSSGIDILNSIENITGTNLSGSADTITGSNGANILKGLAGNDTIYELDGADIVEGGSGNDYIYAGAGDDIIDGDDTDAGTINGTSDTLDFTLIAINDDTNDNRVIDANDGDATAAGVDAYNGIEIDLSDTNAQRIHAEYGTDTITNIENVIGSDKNDYIKGNTQANILEGRSGNDYLIGLEGADRLIGGAGTDTADYSTGSQNIVIDMTKAQTNGSEDTYRVSNDGYGNKEFIDGIENIITGSGDDTIYGDGESNEIITGAGNNTIRGGENADIIDGGADNDTADFSDLAFGVTVDLDSDNNGANNAEGTALSNGKTDTLRQIENVIGTDRADNITGDDKSNTLFGGADNDTLKGLQGADYIDGGSGVDDTVDFSDGTQGIKIDLTVSQTLGTDTTYRVQDDGFGNKEFIDGIENIIGTNSVDTIIGDNQDNKLEGGAGDDTIYGGLGADTLVGGIGADTFKGGSGDDIIYGNAENISSVDAFRDVIDYSDSGIGVKVNLSSTQSSILLSKETSTILGLQTAVGEGTDRLYDIQDIIGSASQDTLVGDDSSNSIKGGLDNDLIIGSGGADILMGESGDDTILGGLDGDSIYGGTFDGTNSVNIGSDTVDYSYITDSKAINADLSRTNNEEIFQIGNAANFDHVKDIENIIGTKNADILKGSDDFATTNTLDGYKGNDTFYSSLGLDSFIGGDGIDTLDYSSVDLNNGGNRVIVDLGLQKATDDGYHDGANAVEDYISGIEIVKGTTGDDTLYGDSNSNSLIGNAGIDIIDGREGSDYLEGNAGNDTIDGGTGADTIYGGADDDLLNGGADNDTLYGEDGNDTLIGGKGNDTFSGGANSDTLTYLSAESAITVTLSDGDSDFGTIVSTSEGTDTLLDHIEIIKGSNYSDNIQGFNGTAIGGIDYSDTIYGESNNDIIYGGIGNDTIYGGSGNDIIRGQAGNDFIDGESGTDTVDYSDAQVGVEVYLGKVDEDGNALAHETLEDGFGTWDDISNVSTVIGSSLGDTIMGTNGWNDIRSGLGDDTIIATDGGDTIDGGGNTVAGDWLSFKAIGSGITATMANGTIAGGLGTTTITDIENLFGSAYIDVMTGDSNDNSINGYLENDTLFGGAGNDFLLGGEGNDILRGETGIDRYDGGEGEDLIDFYYTTSAVEVNLSTTGVINDGYGNEETQVTSIENIGGTLDYNDILTGDNNNNKIYGYGGADTLSGLGGVDTLYGGEGNDKLITGAGAGDVAFGGNGTDTFTGNLDGDILIGGTSLTVDDTLEDWIDYSTLTGTVGINVDLSKTVVHDNADDTLDGTYSEVTLSTGGTADLVVNIENIIGSNNDDTLGGNSGINSIKGGLGDDTIYASAGQDDIDGEDGSDWLSLEYFNPAGNIDLQNNNVGDAKAFNIENVIDFNGNRAETVWGSNVDNTFIMYDGNDHVLGRLGNDVYDMGAGDDRMSANYGNDTLIGGDGTDILDYWNNIGANQGVKIILKDVDLNKDGDTSDSGESTTLSNIAISGLPSLADGNYDFFTITDGRGDTDYLYKKGDGTADIESFNLTNYADTISADDNINVINAYGGNDTIYSQGGDDYINAGSGNDYIDAGTGNDQVYGDDAQDIIYGNDGNDRLHGGNDVDQLYGDAGNDTLWGDAGSDTLRGGADDDTLYGGVNNDTLFSDAGTDYIDGGTDGDGLDIDTLMFDGGTQRVVVNMSASTINYDATTIASNRMIDSYGNTETILNIENVVGTNFDDTFIGNDVKNTLIGNSGNDYFYASLGNDDLQGGANIDTLDLSTVTTENGANVDLEAQDNAIFTVGGTQYNQSLSSIENVIGTSQDDNITGTSDVALGNTINGGAGNDHIIGLAGDDTLDGGADNDTLNGGVGNDSLIGGLGNDTIDYSTSLGTSHIINIDTIAHGSAAANQSTGDGTDILSGIENVIGSNSDDTIHGSALVNTLSGGASKDTIYGYDNNDTLNGDAGEDSLYGGNGNDLINGGTSNDYIDGGADDDILNGDSGNDTFVTNAGNDTIDGGADIDLVDYSSIASALNVTLLDNGAAVTVSIDGTDVLTNIEALIGSNTAGDSIVGNNQDNTFYGMAGNDTLKGVSGTNVLSGGDGADRIFSGSGNDTIDGGTGNSDWVDYSEDVDGTNVDLRAGTASGHGNDLISGIEHVQLGNGTNTVQGSENVSNSINGGTGTDTLTYSNANGSISVNIASGTATGDGSGTDTFTSIEGFVGSSFADTFTNDSIDGLVIDGLADSNGSDEVDYTSIGATNLTVTIDGVNPITVSDGVNSDLLSNIEIITAGSGADNFIVSSTTGLDTLDAGAGIDSLTLSGNIDLSSVTLLNFENIIVANGDTLTLNATDLDDQTMNIELQGTGSLIIKATGLESDHDFDNITINKTGTANGTVTLDVSSTVDLTSHDINGTNSILDTVTVNNGATVTLTETQITSGGFVVNGAGSAVVEIEGNSSTDFTSILDLTTPSNETIVFTANSTFTGDFDNSTVAVNNGVTLSTSALIIDSIVVDNSGNINISDLDNNSGTANADLSTITGSGTANATWDGTSTFTGNLGTVSVNIASGVMSSDGSKIDGKTITGAGTLTITGRGDGNLDVSNITTTPALDINITDGTTTLTGVTIDVDASGSSSIINMTTSELTNNITGGSESDTLTYTGVSGTYTGTLTSIENFSSANSVTFTASELNGKTIDFTGAGNINVSGYTGAQDLSNISSSGTGSLFLNITNDATLGVLPADFNINLAANNITLTADATNIHGLIVTDNANNTTVQINNLDAALSADLTNVNADTINADWSGGTGTFTTSLSNVDNLTISSGSMSIDSTLLNSSVNITNNATMNITNLDGTPALNISTLSGSGTTTAISDGNVTFTGNLGSADLTITNNSTFTANAGAVELGTGTITVNSGSTLLVDSTEIIGQSVNGAGTTNVVNMESTSGTADYSTITTTTTTLNWSGTGTDFSGNIGNADLTVSSGTMNILSGATLENGSLTVSIGATLNIHVDEANNQAITNNGIVNVTSFQDNLAVDVSGITGAGTTNLNWTASTATFTGDIGNANLLVSGGNMIIGNSADISGTGSLSVSGAGTLTLDAVKANTETITGTGTTAVTNLDGTATADLSNITSTNVTAISDGNVTFTGNLGKAVTTVTGNSTFTIDNTADLGTATFSVNTGSTIIAEASKLTGKTVNGTGTVSITNLDGILNADFGNINSSTTLNVDWSGTATYIGNLTNVDTLNVSSGTMSVDANILNSATSITNSATINIANLEVVPSMDLTKITGGTTNADWSGNGTFTGNLGSSNLTVSNGLMTVSTGTISGSGTVVVNGGATLSADATKLSGETISGAGNITISNLQSKTDSSFTGLDTGLDVTANWASSSATYTGNLTNVDALTISSGTMTVTDDILGTLSTSGSGNIVVQVDTSSSQDFANLNLSGSETIQFIGNSTFTGNFQNSTVSVNSGVTLTTDAVNLNGKIATGTGTIELTNLDATPAANLSGLAAGLTVNGIIANSVTYTGSLISLDSLTVNSGATLSTDAVNITGVTTTNNGTVSVTNLESVPTMDLTKITGGTTNADWSGNGTFTGNLGTSNLLVSSGIMTITTGVISNANSIVVDGTIVADASKVTTETISGAGTLTVNNLDSSLNADFANLTVNTINVDWSGTATYNGNLTNVDALTISSGTMSVDDSILGTINVNGSGNLTVNANDSSVDLSNVSNTLGTVTINDSASNVNIVGSAGNDVLNLNGGDDTVNLGAGNDTVNVDINNLNANDTLNDTSGTDTLNITSSGTISSDVLVNQVSGFETLNMSNGDDTVTFDDTTDFNNFISEFTDIVDAGGNDTLSFGSVGVSGDLDFTKLGEFENLNLSSANDNITLSGDESTNVNGGAGNDTFSLDFSNVSNFVIDGGTNSAGDDKINITGNSATISSDTNIFGAGAFDNIEALDLTAANLNVGADATDGGVNAEFTLTGSLINEWTNNGLSSGSLKLTLDADAASKLEFTNSGGTKYGGDDTGTSSITNGTYTLDNGAELIISGL
uniref:hypothetical protein n=1 Tax=Aliarcobacter sp. TaxID=2321116 RepID=UPI0040472DEE